LSRTDVAVVCAGPKALLDVPKTLEYLETLGVPVITAGSDRFPAFWSRDSGLPTPIRLDDPAGIAHFIRARAALALPGGVLVANPIPEASEIPAGEIRPAIEAALKEAMAAGVAGKAVTPFLLDAILKQTAGRSLTANIALIRNNARLAAKIAVAMAGASPQVPRPGA
jgi:pseudouridine-5'-phosphate glycosidase